MVEETFDFQILETEDTVPLAVEFFFSNAFNE